MCTSSSPPQYVSVSIFTRHWNSFAFNLVKLRPNGMGRGRFTSRSPKISHLETMELSCPRNPPYSVAQLGALRYAQISPIHVYTERKVTNYTIRNGAPNFQPYLLCKFCIFQSFFSIAIAAASYCAIPYEAVHGKQLRRQISSISLDSKLHRQSSIHAVGLCPLPPIALKSAPQDYGSLQCSGEDSIDENCNMRREKGGSHEWESWNAFHSNKKLLSTGTGNSIILSTLQASALVQNDIIKSGLSP